MTDQNTLINIICAMNYPIAALSGDALTPDDERLYMMICNTFFGGRDLTRDETDALLELAEVNAPITFRANSGYNYTPCNSTIVDIGTDMAIVHDYCLN